MNVAELAATLGWDVDFETIARYQGELNRAREATAKLEADTLKLAEAEALRAEILGDSNRALAMISPGAPGLPSAKGGAVDGAAGGAMKWGRALEIANAGLGVALKGWGILSSGLGKIRGAFDATATAAAHYNDTAAKLGIGVEAVQELGFAASQSGTDLNALSSGMGTLSNKVDAASKGSKDAAASLRAVGLSAREIRSGAVTLDSALGSIADKFATMPDGARKSALAVDLFGANGTKLIPLLNKGSKGIGELRAEAQRLGIVMGKDATDAAAALGDEQAKIGAQFAGIRNQVVAALLPMLSEMASRLSAWLEENREQIVEVLTVVGKGILYVAQAVAAVAQAIGVAVQWAIENWKLLAAVLATVMLPLTLVVASIMAIVYAFPYIIDAAEAVAEAVTDAFEAASDAIAGAFDAVGRAFTAVWNGIKSAARSVASFFEGIGRGILGAFDTAIDGIVSAVDFVIDKLNAAIRLANELPWVDIKTLDNVGKKSAPTTGRQIYDMLAGPEPRTAATAGRGGAVVNNNFSAINVTSNAADPQQVAVHVRTEVGRELQRVMMEADLSIPPSGVA